MPSRSKARGESAARPAQTSPIVLNCLQRSRDHTFDVLLTSRHQRLLLRCRKWNAPVSGARWLRGRLGDGRLRAEAARCADNGLVARHLPLTSPALGSRFHRRHQRRGAGSLRQAIINSNSAGGSNNIIINGDVGTITLTSGDLPIVQNNATIVGNGNTLSGGGSFRGLFVGACRRAPARARTGRAPSAPAHARPGRAGSAPPVGPGGIRKRLRDSASTGALTFLLTLARGTRCLQGSIDCN
jgi:hypothetical protein